MIKTTGFKLNGVDVGSKDYLSKQDVFTDYPDYIGVGELLRSGVLFGWGYNGFGQLGNGVANTFNPSPIMISTNGNWKALSCGGNFSLGIKSTGTLWAWGASDTYQKGDGYNTIAERKSSPIQIGSDINWRAISAGPTHSTALKTDGTLWTWGSGEWGMNGKGSTADISTPTQIGSDTNWSKISSKGNFTVAIKNNGTLWGWGANQFGQVGNGTYDHISTPVQIGLDTNWKTISNSIDNTVAIRTDGTLWAWGSNNGGQVGDGTQINKSSPVQVGSGTNWKQAEARTNGVLALKTDGTLWSFGSNIWGQLGDGTIVSKSTPVQIGSLTTWKKIFTNGPATVTGFALKTDGTLWAWGYNGHGLLVDGTSNHRSSPVQVGSLTTWSYLQVGSYHVLALT